VKEKTTENDRGLITFKNQSTIKALRKKLGLYSAKIFTLLLELLCGEEICMNVGHQ
jgi:hypothetical protein